MKTQTVLIKQPVNNVIEEYNISNIPEILWYAFNVSPADRHIIKYMAIAEYRGRMRASLLDQEFELMSDSVISITEDNLKKWQDHGLILNPI